MAGRESPTNERVVSLLRETFGSWRTSGFVKSTSRRTSRSWRRRPA